MSTASQNLRERATYVAALALTAAHIGYFIWQGPQPHGERPLASPAVWVANDIGFWALSWLAATLACTPARVWLHVSWPGRWRRTLGLTAAALAVLHVGVWVVAEHHLQLFKIAEDFAEDLWLWPGLLALVGLAVLALTSPAAMVKRLGASRWRQVHKLVYAVGVLGVLHYALRAEADPQHWIGFALLFALLLGVRGGRPT